MGDEPVSGELFFTLVWLFARNILTGKISNRISNGNIKPVYYTLTGGTANSKLFDEKASSSLLIINLENWKLLYCHWLL